jgi:integrase
MAKLGHAIRKNQTEGGNATALAAIRVLLLTGLRRTECLALRRSWVDGRAGCIRFEDTKSGPQLRPIGKEAVKLIEAQVVQDGCPWVFPASHGAGHMIGLPKILGRICAAAGLQDVTVHVLRHSFAATAAEMGFSVLTIAGLLGHSVPGVTARYAHMPDLALVVAADRVATRIQLALDGGAVEAEIIQLRSGAA